MQLPLRLLCHIRPLINRDTANAVACSIAFSRLDYCNAFLYGVSEHNISWLQRVQNSLARVVCQAPYHLSATHLRCALHWLPARQRIEYKVASLTFRVRHTTSQHTCQSSSSTNVLTISTCSSDKVLLVVPRTKTVFASRAFRVAAPKT